MAQPVRKHALIIVDLQRDFLPGGALGVPGGDKAVPVIRAVLEVHRWDCVVMTQDWHPMEHVSFAVNHPGLHVLDVVDTHYGRQMLWPVHCVEGTEGADIVGVDVNKADIILRKGREAGVDSYSAFYAADNETKTGLAGCLRERGITDVWVCGLALDYCVSFTAIDAAREGFEVHIVTDASAAIDANSSLDKAEAAWRLACIDRCLAEEVLDPDEY